MNYNAFVKMYMIFVFYHFYKVYRLIHLIHHWHESHHVLFFYTIVIIHQIDQIFFFNIINIIFLFVLEILIIPRKVLNAKKWFWILTKLWPQKCVSHNNANAPSNPASISKFIHLLDSPGHNNKFYIYIDVLWYI